MGWVEPTSMNKRLYFVALAVGSVASIGNLQAQDNQNNNTTQSTSEDRTARPERGQQDLKGQIDRLSADVTDLQDRVDRGASKPRRQIVRDSHPSKQGTERRERDAIF
jgi:hypothetical protein